MCGRLNVSDDPFVQGLLALLKVELSNTGIRPIRFARAASQVQIVIQRNDKRELNDATWWLLLEQTDTSFKPSKYTSFNTRYDKLNVPRSAGFVPFRQSRCIVPVKGFGETEFVLQQGRKVPLHYHDLIAKDGALALGGLYKEYIHSVTGEVRYACSIVTLAPHDKLKFIHSKASPLILPQNSTLDAWLDPSNQEVSMFNQLLQPNLPQNLVAQQINKPSEYQSIGQPFEIHRD